MIFNRKWFFRSFIGVILLTSVSIATCQTIEPRKRIVKLDSTEFVKRGVYNMHISWLNGCATYQAYRSHTWKKKTKFSPYYILIKTSKGWKLQSV